MIAIPGAKRKSAIAGIAAGVIVLIGFSRLVLGVHYFSDVIGGYAAGTAWLAVCISASAGYGHDLV